MVMFSFLILPLGGAASAGVNHTIVPCGTILASYKGIPARSNQNYPYGSCAGRSVYGLRYQCVEYVRRFYHLVKGIELGEGTMAGNWEHAGSLFDDAAEKGLDAFKNGGPVSPRPDDIIVFQGGPYGHVAIVTEVADDHIEFIEQNFSPTGIDRLAYDPLTHRVADRIVPGGKFIMKGWLRPGSDRSSHTETPVSKSFP
jgi:surface antigen